MLKWIFAFCFAFLFILFIGVEMQEQRMVDQLNQSERMTMSLESRLEKLENLEPDIGDFMKQLQLEMAKLWYAEKFRNKDLALYEISEMEESIAGVDTLNPTINDVNASGVLDALKNTQIAAMQKAIMLGDGKTFLKEYNETILSCNECHRAVGRGFNRITVPSAPPVTNQEWKPAGR